MDEGRSSGQPAQTRWRVSSRRWRGGHRAAGAEPITGRTHQLRVHCAAKGWPILGDPIYGARARGTLQLHARRIEIPLYKNKEPIVVEAPVPAHMRAAAEACSLRLEF